MGPAQGDFNLKNAADALGDMEKIDTAGIEEVMGEIMYSAARS